MPFRRLRLRQFYTRLGVALLAGLLPLLLGVLIVSWQTFAGMKQDAEERLLHARRCWSVPWITPIRRRPWCRGRGASLRGGGAGAAGSGGDRAGRAHRQPGQRGSGLLFALRPLSGPFKLADYANGQLDLMRGNPVTPGRPLVVYRQPVGSTACWSASTATTCTIFSTCSAETRR